MSYIFGIMHDIRHCSNVAASGLLHPEHVRIPGVFHGGDEGSFTMVTGWDMSEFQCFESIRK